MLIENRENPDKEIKTAVLMIEGGIGDHLLATPLLRGFRKHYPRDKWIIVVMAMHHEIYGLVDPIYNDGDHIICTNPNIDFLYSMRYKSNFYTLHARHADIIYRQNPYIQSPHRFGKYHFAEVWCKIHGFDMDVLSIDYYPTEEEDLKGKKLYETFKHPIIIIQPFGANDPFEPLKNTNNKDWFLDRWQVVISWLVNRGYTVIQIGKAGEHVFDKVFSLVGHTDIRETAIIMKYASFFISIDSFLMHVAKAFNKIGIVLWGRTNPFRLGYMENYNLFKLHSCPEIFCGRPEGILFDVAHHLPHFTPWNCPHRNCMDAITIADVCKGVGIIERNLRLDPISWKSTAKSSIIVQ